MECYQKLEETTGLQSQLEFRQLKPCITFKRIPVTKNGCKLLADDRTLSLYSKT